MTLLGATRLLLLALLLRRTRENAVRTMHHSSAAPLDDTVYYGEFCLCTSDEALCLQAQPATTPPPPEEPAGYQVEPVNNVIQMVETTTPVQEGEGCRCSEENIKWPASSTIRRVTKWSPDETCPSNQYIATLTDKSVVCVSAITFLPFVESFLSWLNPRPAPTPGPSLSFPATPSVGFHPATTRPPEASTKESPHTVKMTGKQHAPRGEIPIRCPACGSLMTQLDEVDPEDVALLYVRRPPPFCPATMSVIFWVSDDLCYQLQHFEAVLQKLGTAFFPVVEPSDTSKTIDGGCQCQSAKIQSTEQEAFIWAPNENCSSTEVIEINSDGGEQCVSVGDLSAYLREFDRALSTMGKDQGEPGGICRLCSPDETWETIERSAVQALDFTPPTSHCSGIMVVRMRSKPDFCVDALHPLFRDLLVKL